MEKLVESAYSDNNNYTESVFKNFNTYCRISENKAHSKLTKEDIKNAKALLKDFRINVDIPYYVKTVSDLQRFIKKTIKESLGDD